MYVALITAAGESTRFPGNKLLYRYSGDPLIVRSVRSALDSRVEKVVVVVGYMREAVAELLKDYFSSTSRVEVVENPFYKEGMSRSIKAGLEYALRKYGSLRAVLVSPGDAAWIPGVVYDILVDKHEEFGWKIVVPTHLKRRGHPILFSSHMIPFLMSIDEETRGLKRVVRDFWFDVREVELPYPSVLLDLDTITDLNRVKEQAWV
ncbi:Nucleotidyl transferase [Thermogladius calderae 1633]|uniref:Nucleotidyl transferase n=1 Tax=Thermogladius calderae (strain DSM 22663 / VKM B-2946 / 1633) TaxID=1184251 RepID=I3TET7_THEC1|nr:nucleotidyltransferase family protein [Thermogladius calderae]AFK51275.1 Nucleotidyl transferase [Thermogladius calderae 1633]